MRFDFLSNQKKLIIGENGSGKCLKKSVCINVNITDEQTETDFDEFIRSKRKEKPSSYEKYINNLATNELKRLGSETPSYQKCQ